MLKLAEAKGSEETVATPYLLVISMRLVLLFGMHLGLQLIHRRHQCSHLFLHGVCSGAPLQAGKSRLGPARAQAPRAKDYFHQL